MQEGGRGIERKDGKRLRGEEGGAVDKAIEGRREWKTKRGAGEEEGRVADRRRARIAEVPDDFREQAPLPVSKVAVLRGIATCNAAPELDRMSASLAARPSRGFQTQSNAQCTRRRSSSDLLFAASVLAVTTFLA